MCLTSFFFPMRSRVDSQLRNNKSFRLRIRDGPCDTHTIRVFSSAIELSLNKKHACLFTKGRGWRTRVPGSGSRAHSSVLLDIGLNRMARSRWQADASNHTPGSACNPAANTSATRACTNSSHRSLRCGQHPKNVAVDQYA